MSNAPLKDTQNESDDRRIAIDRVGVKALRYPLQIRDKAHAVQHTIATCALTVDLPHHFKGTHMSRFVEVLNEFAPELHVKNMRTILERLVERLDSEVAHVEFAFPFFLEKPAPVTGARGMIDYNVRFVASIEKGAVDFVVTVVVPVTTLCPCSKAISAHGAHNQRGEVTFSVRFSKPIWIEDLVRVVEESASSELYSLLKRPDEKAVTERAYENPVFVEDLVRNVAQRAEAHELHHLVSDRGGKLRVDPQSQRLRADRAAEANVKELNRGGRGGQACRVGNGRRQTIGLLTVEKRSRDSSRRVLRARRYSNITPTRQSHSASLRARRFFGDEENSHRSMDGILPHSAANCFWILAQIEDRPDDQTGSLHRIENTVMKPADDEPPETIVKTRGGVGVLSGACERIGDGRIEYVAQSGSKLLVEIPCPQEVRFGSSDKDNLQH